MIRLWLRLACWMSALLMLFLLVLNAAPADDASLKTLLLPTCGNPCFLDIQPGLTPLPEARSLLENHPWVREVELIFSTPTNPDENRFGTLRWRWNGLQPGVLRSPFLEAGEVTIQQGVVQSIKVTTSIPFGDVWLFMGPPDYGYIGTSRVYLERLDNHAAVYTDQGLKLQTLLPHDPRIATFWNAFVEVVFEAAPPERQMYHLPCWLRCE